MKDQVTYRNIAKMLASALPLNSNEFCNKIAELLSTIKALPIEAKIALRSAYIFSRKVPKPEREDLFQELFKAIWEVRTKDEPFAYAIARQDWRNWWQKYMTRQHYLAGSLNRTVLDSDNHEVELGELIVGECEFERKIDGKLDAERIWGKIPDPVKPVINRRLLGFPLNATERQRLSRFVRQHGHEILLASN